MGNSIGVLYFMHRNFKVGTRRAVSLRVNVKKSLLNPAFHHIF